LPAPSDDPGGSSRGNEGHPRPPARPPTALPRIEPWRGRWGSRRRAAWAHLVAASSLARRQGKAESLVRSGSDVYERHLFTHSPWRRPEIRNKWNQVGIHLLGSSPPARGQIRELGKRTHQRQAPPWLRPRTSRSIQRRGSRGFPPGAGLQMRTPDQSLHRRC
jgi:hypothetical protein